MRLEAFGGAPNVRMPQPSKTKLGSSDRQGRECWERSVGAVSQRSLPGVGVHVTNVVGAVPTG